MKLIEFEKYPEYAEENQSVYFKYSFLERVSDNLDTFTKVGNKEKTSFELADKDIFKELFYPVKCKDFLDDILMANMHNTILQKDIYGFKYPKEFKVKPYLWMSIHSDECLLKSLRKNLYLLNELEDSDKTQVFDVEGSSTTIIIRVPTMWTTVSTTLFSIYSFLLRAISQISTEAESIEEICYLLDKKDTTDSRITKKILSSGISLKFLIDNRETIFKESPIVGIPSVDLDDAFFEKGLHNNKYDINLNKVHNMTGLLTFCKLYKKYPDNRKISKFNSLFIDKYKKLLSDVSSIDKLATRSLIKSGKDLGGYLTHMRDN